MTALPVSVQLDFVAWGVLNEEYRRLHAVEEALLADWYRTPVAGRDLFGGGAMPTALRSATDTARAARADCLAAREAVIRGLEAAGLPAAVVLLRHVDKKGAFVEGNPDRVLVWVQALFAEPGVY
jgi:hypothetical protein